MAQRDAVPPLKRTTGKPQQKSEEGVQLCSLSTPLLTDHSTTKEALPDRLCLVHTPRVGSAQIQGQWIY